VLGSAAVAGRGKQVRRSLAAIGGVALLAVLASLGGALRGGETGGDRVFVYEVVDGDTIRVVNGSHRETVRLIGVDAPETHHPVKGQEPYGPEATEFTRAALQGEWVALEYEDGPRKDKYHRTLAYVRLGDGTLFNQSLIEAGYAEVFRRFPFRYAARFRAAERRARASHVGMWQRPAERPAGRIVGNSRSKIYHLPGQSHYDDVAERNRVYFDSEEAARAAGYRRARR
jgi:micrococcal nuclease